MAGGYEQVAIYHYVWLAWSSVFLVPWLPMLLALDQHRRKICWTRLLTEESKEGNRIQPRSSSAGLCFDIESMLERFPRRFFFGVAARVRGTVRAGLRLSYFRARFLRTMLDTLGGPPGRYAKFDARDIIEWSER